MKQPIEYRDFVRKLIEVVNEGMLRLVKADCPLEELVEGNWPGDVLGHDFQCTMCGRRFALHANTYHGHVEWKPGTRGTDEIRTVH